MRPLPNTRRDRTITLLFALAHATLIFALVWSRFSTCHNRTFDLALYARTAWGLAHGSVWNPIADASFVHLHASWILLPLGWLGRVFDTVPVLLAAQSLAIGACVVPLTRIATRHLGARGLWIAPLLWLAYPNLGHVGSYEMHPGTLALLPLCWALDALDRDDGGALAWASGCVLLCRADYALLTLVMGTLLWTATTTRTSAKRWGRGIAGTSVVYLLGVLLAQRVDPAHGVTSAELHFGPWGGSPLGIVTSFVSEPARVLEHFVNVARLGYLPRVLAPLGFVSLLSPRWLWIAAPSLALNLISVWPTSTRLDSHYLTPAVPVLIVSALIGATTLQNKWPRLRSAWLVAPVVASVWLGGLPWSRDFGRSAFTTDDPTNACLSIVRAIPAQASVQAPDPMLPHLAERSVVHRSPPPERMTDYVVLDTTHRQRFAHQEDLLRTTEEPALRNWLARPDHGVVAVNGNLVLLGRGLDPRSGWSKRYFRTDGASEADHSAGTPLTQCLAIERAVLDDTVVRLHLRATGSCPVDLAIRLGTDPRPRRVDLLFDGLLSPIHLRAGDRLVSIHPLKGTELATRASALWVGALRSSGARPDPSDPWTVRIPLDSAP